MDYFNKKKNEEKKFVINTIRIPKLLANLNKRLPASQYESDLNNKKKEFYGLSFQNYKILPALRARYNSNEDDKVKIRLKKNNHKRNKEKDIDVVNSKSMEIIPQQMEEKENKEKKKNYIQRTNRFDKYNKFNTLKMIVDKDRPFNYKGKIDIIVEE